MVSILQNLDFLLSFVKKTWEIVITNKNSN